MESPFSMANGKRTTKGNEMTIKDNTIMRAIDRKRKQAKALHGYALHLMATPGRERDANNVSKEASIADAEIEKMVSHCAQWNDA